MNISNYYIEGINVTKKVTYILKINWQIKTLLNTRKNKLSISDPFLHFIDLYFVNSKCKEVNLQNNLLASKGFPEVVKAELTRHSEQIFRIQHLFSVYWPKLKSAPDRFNIIWPVLTSSNSRICLWLFNLEPGEQFEQWALHQKMSCRWVRGGALRGQ